MLWRKDGRQRGITYDDHKAAERAARRIAVDNRLPAEMVTEPVPDVPTSPRS